MGIFLPRNGPSPLDLPVKKGYNPAAETLPPNIALGKSYPNVSNTKEEASTFLHSNLRIGAGISPRPKKIVLFQKSFPIWANGRKMDSPDLPALHGRRLLDRPKIGSGDFGDRGTVSSAAADAS